MVPQFVQQISIYFIFEWMTYFQKLFCIYMKFKVEDDFCFLYSKIFFFLYFIKNTVACSSSQKQKKINFSLPQSLLSIKKNKSMKINFWLWTRHPNKKKQRNKNSAHPSVMKQMDHGNVYEKTRINITQTAIAKYLYLLKKFCSNSISLAQILNHSLSR